MTQVIERLANSKYTQSRTKSKPASKRKRNCSSQSSATSSSSAEVSSSESENGWRYKRRKIESKPSSRRDEGNTGPSDPEVASHPIRNRGLMRVAQRPDIPCKTSAVVPSDSDAVNSLIRQARSCTDPALDNLSERCSSENTTCEILNSLGADDEEIKVAPKLNDKLAQLVQDRWQASLSYSKLKEKSQHYLPPENAIFKVPLANLEIWSRMSNQLRTSDLSFINIQRNIQKATIAISQVADQVLQKKDQLDVKSVLHTSLDAIALLGHTANKLSVVRHTNIRPALGEEYRGLCKLEFPGSDYLFGQDLAKSMAQTREMNNISTNVFKKPSNFYQQRFPTNNKYQKFRQKTDKKRADSFLWKDHPHQNGSPRKKKARC